MQYGCLRGEELNYKCSIDTVNKLIDIQPKAGSWAAPFFGFALAEKDDVKPHMAVSNKASINVSTASYIIADKEILGLKGNLTATTNILSYSVHYISLPTYIIFGNYPSPLYKTVLK